MSQLCKPRANIRSINTKTEFSCKKYYIIFSETIATKIKYLLVAIKILLSLLLKLIFQVLIKNIVKIFTYEIKHITFILVKLFESTEDITPVLLGNSRFKLESLTNPILKSAGETREAKHLI